MSQGPPEPSPSEAASRGGRPAPAAPPRRAWPKWTAVGLVALLFAVWAGVFIYRTSMMGIDGQRHYCLFDDSMISMRYAWNLAHGNGLAWNPGERVEGITNLLMTLLMAVPTRLLEKSAAVLSVQIAGVLTLLAVAFVTMRIGEALLAARGLRGSATLSALFFACALAYYPLDFWTLMGMETGLLALLLLAAVWVAFRIDGRAAWSPALALLLGLAFVTRPDAAVPAALIMLHRLYAIFRRRGWLRAIVLESAVIAAFVAAVSGFRWLYYGRITPNTYTLKVEGFTVMERLVNGLAFNDRFLHSMIVPLAIAALVVAARPHRHATLVLGLLLSSMAYEVWVGGDAWPYWRINAPFVPATLALCAVGLVDVLRRVERQWRMRRGPALVRAVLIAGMVALLGFANTGFLGEMLLQRPAYWIEAHWQNVDTALALREVLKPTATVGVLWGGTIPYYSGLSAVDFLGKSDAYVASLRPDQSRPWIRPRPDWRPYEPGHNKYDMVHSVIELQPTFVQPCHLIKGEIAEFVHGNYQRHRYKGVPLLLRKGSREVDWAALKAGLPADRSRRRRARNPRPPDGA